MQEKSSGNENTTGQGSEKPEPEAGAEDGLPQAAPKGPAQDAPGKPHLPGAPVEIQL